MQGMAGAKAWRETQAWHVGETQRGFIEAGVSDKGVEVLLGGCGGRTHL